MFQSSSLREPYGTCGEKYLHDFEDETYTYSRCRRQCEKDALAGHCDCLDAFMPGMHCMSHILYIQTCKLF